VDPAVDPVLRAAAAHVVVASLDAPVPDDVDVHHLARVLRLRTGAPVTATDGSGRWCPCEWTGGGLAPTGAVVVEERPEPLITIGFTPVKGDRPEWTVQKLTELGVDRIVPLVADRSVVRWSGPRAERALERLRRAAREAAAQSRRSWLPEVAEPVTLAVFVREVEAAGGHLALAELGGDPPSLERPAVAVGPEGGWSDAERELCGATVGLGDAVLRAETAAVAAGTLLAGLRSALVGGVASQNP